MSLNRPDRAPAVAPTAAPRSGLRKRSPTNMPQKPPPTAPAAVRFTAWSNLIAPFLVFGDDDRILHLDQILLLHVQERRTHFECGDLVVKHNCHKPAHNCLLPFPVSSGKPTPIGPPVSKKNFPRHTV